MYVENALNGFILHIEENSKENTVFNYESQVKIFRLMVGVIQVCAEGVFHFLKSNSQQLTTVPVSASVSVNNVEITVLVTSFTVADDAKYDSSLLVREYPYCYVCFDIVL